MHVTERAPRAGAVDDGPFGWAGFFASSCTGPAQVGPGSPWANKIHGHLLVLRATSWQPSGLAIPRNFTHSTRSSWVHASRSMRRPGVRQSSAQATPRLPVPSQAVHVMHPVPLHRLHRLLTIQSESCIEGLLSLESSPPSLLTPCRRAFIFATFSGAKMPAPLHAVHTSCPEPWQLRQNAGPRCVRNDAACIMP